MNFNNQLLDYYKFILQMDNYFSLKFNKWIFERFPSNIKKIKNNIADHEKDISIKKFELKVEHPIICYSLSSISDFFDEILFLEKCRNFVSQQYIKGYKKPKKIEESEYFELPSSTDNQICLFIDFLKEKPGRTNSKYIPLLVIAFPLLNQDKKELGIIAILEQIKKFLGMEYQESILEDSQPLEEPSAFINPNLIEPYSCEFKYLKVSNINQCKEFTNQFLNEYKIDKKDIYYGDYLCQATSNFNQSLIAMYNSIKKSGYNDLVKEYFTVHDRKKSNIEYPDINDSDILTTKQEIETFSKHYGAYDKKNYLAETQRKAFSVYLQKHRNIIPVNGAPGTGKTSLLRAICGDYIVKSGLEVYHKYKTSKDIIFPPPIVCTSTNNQALINISEGITEGFEAFAIEKDGQKVELLYQRWLNYEYNPNKDKLKNDTEIEDEESAEDIEQRETTNGKFQETFFCSIN